VLSSPSVSSTISDPSNWEFFFLITCKHNSENNYHTSSNVIVGN
jgi:hypothetical protein